MRRVLIVDDIEENRRLIASILKKHRDQYEIIVAKNGRSVVEMFNDDEFIKPDIILLDIMMPDLNGFEVAAKIKEFEIGKNIPIIFITAMTDIDNKVKAFREGGVDYITKPFYPEELLARIDCQLELKAARELLIVQNEELIYKNKLLKDSEAHLNYLVEKRTFQLEETTLALVNTLEEANLMNDEDTGNHIRRVGEYSAVIAEKYGCSFDMVRKIKMYAPLHDVGKVGIPSSILKKPGPLTADEFNIMKQHVAIGSKILKNENIDIVAKNIALYHHEKWAGTGYLHGLSGEDIPIEARIVCISDVFDALVSERVYKFAFLQEEAEEIIRNSSGSHFEPRIVDVFFEVIEKIKEIKNDLK